MNAGFYVSVKDGSRSGLLLGPFPTHAEALERIETVRRWVVAREPRAHFYGFGTARLSAPTLRPGLLNSQLHEVTP